MKANVKKQTIANYGIKQRAGTSEYDVDDDDDDDEMEESSVLDDKVSPF